jgi:hypothetical protein
MRPCPQCETPAVTAAIDQLLAAMGDLGLEPHELVPVQQAFIRLLRLVAHGTDQQPQPGGPQP